MKMMILAWLLPAMALAADPVFLRTYEAAGTRGAFLARGAGARPAAMGAAFTGVADDASALAWNPGGLGQLSSFSALAQHDLAGAGIGISSLSAALPMGETVAGLSVAHVAYGTIDTRDEAGLPAGEVSLSDVAVSQGWAFRNPRWLGGGWSGVAAELVQEARDTALLGFSVGSLIPLDDRFTAGWAILHAGPAARGGALPRSLRLGASYHGGPMQAAVDVAYGLTDHLLDLGAGAEVRPSFFPMAAVRAGWRQEGRSQGLAGARGATAGFGLRMGRLGLDYAYQPFGDLATTHRISVEYRMPGARRPARLAPPVASQAPAKPAAPKKKEPTVKVMPVLAAGDDDGAPLKSAAAPVTPLRRDVPVSSTAAAMPAPAAVKGAPVQSVEAAPPDEGAPKIDPQLPPPAELVPSGDEDEGLRGGTRRGGARPGAGAPDASSDAPLRRAR